MERRLRIIFSGIFLLANFLNAQLSGGFSPQLYLHNGHISLRDNLPPSPALPEVYNGQPYTFEVALLDTNTYDYVIESCQLNQEQFLVDFGCLCRSPTFIKVWETEQYGRERGSIKRTLVHLMAPSNLLNFECTICVYRCCACAEKSCMSRPPFLNIYSQETVRLSLTAPAVAGYGGSYNGGGVANGGYVGGYTSKDTYSVGGYAGYIPPPPPTLNMVPHEPAAAIGGGVVVEERSDYLWGLPWWLWLLFFLLLLLLLLCLLALCCWLCLRKKKGRKTTSVVTTHSPPPPPPILTQNVSTCTDSQLEQATNVETVTKDNTVAAIAGGHRSRFESSRDESSGFYNVNTTQVGGTQHYKKNRSRSPHAVTVYDASSYNREYDGRAEINNAYEDDEYRNRITRENTRERFHSRDRSKEAAYRNASFDNSSDVGLVGLEGGFDQITRVNRDFEGSDDDFVVDKEVKTTTTTKFVEERRIIEDDSDRVFQTTSIPRIHIHHQPRHHSTVHSSPSEENFREEEIQRAVYAHSLHV